MVRLILVDENLMLLQIHLAVNFDLDLSTITNFFFQSNSEVECALNVIISICVAILNCSDLHDNFCEACGKAGVVKECLELLQGLMACTHDLSDKKVSR